MPSAGELTLDISKYEAAWSQAIADIARLEPAVKKANADLKAMEQAFRKTGQASGYSAAQIKLQKEVVKAQTLELRSAKTELRAFDAQLGKTTVTSKVANAISRGLKATFSAFGIGLGVGGIIAYGKSLLEFGKNIKETSVLASVLPEKLQRIQAAFADKLSADESASVLVTLNNVMKEAARGSVEAQEKLEELGVTMADIKTKSPDQAILMLADHVKAATDPVDELRRVTALFGEEIGTRLIEKLKEGGDAIKTVGDSATVASDAMINAADKGARALDSWLIGAKRLSLEGVSYIKKFTDQIGDIAGDLPTIDGSLKRKQESMDRAARRAQRNAAREAEEKAANPRSNVSGSAGRNKSSHTLSGAAAAMSANASSTLGAEKELLATESKIALEIAPEYVKQKELLVAQEQRLIAQLQVGSSLDKKRVQLQIDQNKEAQRALGYADELRKSAIELNEARASKGRGFLEEQKSSLADIADINNQIAVADRQHDAEKVSALKAQRRDVAMGMVENKEAHDDELSQLEYQTQEIYAQFRGLSGLAAQVSIIAKYDAEITKQIRLQNKEAVILLNKQKEIELIKAKAQEHDVTPAERRKARRELRVTMRKARQQDARESELRNAAARGATGIKISEQLEKDKAINQARSREMRAQDSAQKQEQVMQAILDIAQAVKTS